MKASRLLLFAAMLSAFAFGGCAYSTQPLYKAGDAVVEPRLVGTWTGKFDNDKFQIAIVKTPSDNYEATLGGDNGHKYKYDVHLVRLGNDLYADIFLLGEVLPNDPVLGEPALGATALHTFAKFSFSTDGDTLKYTYLAQENLEQQLTAKTISIAHQKIDNDHTVFSAPPAELQAMLKALADSPNAFRDPDVLHRQKP